MQLEHSFTVPVGVDDAWKVLLDIERIAPCMPGAAVDTIDGDDFTGTVKVKLGPIGLTYKGKASFVEKDEAAHRAVIHAQGRDARGNGTAAATVTATLTEQSGDTKVDVLTDLDITGKPAQFGRGVMVDVGNKLIGQFADCLAGKLAGGEQEVSADAPTVAMPVVAAPPAAPAHAAADAPTAETGPAGAAAAAAAARASAPAAASAAAAAAESAGPASTEAPVVAQVPRREIPTAEVEPINLLESAGPAVVKRLAPIAVALVLLLIILRLRKR
jgi:carbon monoxide dehydrogenase subunit G